MLFVTWAHRDGWPENGIAGYARMQGAIDDAYLAVAAEQQTAVAPVGFAWAQVLNQEGDAGLWQADGSHPTVKGTYLAACVFYAAIFRASPEGLHYKAGVDDAEAARLQRIAAAMVLRDPQRWGLR